uniref:THAP-type domain-containing protein n=1 Tax=Labrus bergylta TaxID=56723 RepID=A0A3Q3F048_9LABR
MPWRCCVPGCKGYDEAKSMGVVFHGLPTRDPPRCRDTPVSRYSGVRVCSATLNPKTTRRTSGQDTEHPAETDAEERRCVPSVFPGRERAEPGCTAAPAPATKRRRTQVKAPHRS